MLSHLVPGSPIALGLLVACFRLVLAFEFSNGFHDTANAVATVIYTNSLKPIVAVIWSGLMNFAGVILGGIAVAYTLVELLPADVLSPPNGQPAIAMLFALFVSALAWNIGTWALGLPNSSSHALVGSLVGIAVANAFLQARGIGQGVDWAQVWSVLLSLLVSPILGFVLAGLLFHGMRRVLTDKHLYEPPEGDRPPIWWMRRLLILTYTGVSFAHGTNDGQKSIGLIMLTLVGLVPGLFALNRDAPPGTVPTLRHDLPRIETLIEQHGDDQKALGLEAVRNVTRRLNAAHELDDVAEGGRPALRNDVNRLIGELKAVEESQDLPKPEKAEAEAFREQLASLVNYAPWWVRVVSAFCLGLGTMVGYRRIVRTLGERIGNTHLVPAQGASAELVAAGLIGAAGFSGFPVSTTHVVTSGIAGTMVGSGAGAQIRTVWQIAAAWILTLPATMILSACSTL